MVNKHTAYKAVLVIIVELLAISLTNHIPENIIQIPHTTLSYLVCGALLAYIVVSIYDKVLDFRRNKIKKELKQITDLALFRYETDNK